MPKSVTLTIRMTPELSAALEKLCAETDRSKAWHVERALAAYVPTVLRAARRLDGAVKLTAG
jgi:predicted transcriptional regulator